MLINNNNNNEHLFHAVDLLGLQTIFNDGSQRVVFQISIINIIMAIEQN